MSKDFSIKMSGYNQIRDTASITFISPKGLLKTVNIHRNTFQKLMDGLLERSEVPSDNPSLHQRELREAILHEIKGDPIEWFDYNANEIMRANANAKVSQ